MRSPRVNWLKNNVQGTRILDIGFVGEHESSAAHQAIATTNPDAELIGVDVKPPQTLADRATAMAVRGDVFDLPFVEGSFDGVVFAEVLEHLPQPFEALQELHRVLEEEGRLYLTTPNPFGGYRYLRQYFARFSFDVDEYLGADDHISFYDPLSLSSILSTIGFSVEALDFRNVSLPKLPTLPDWLFLQRFPFNRLGSYICLIAVKE